MIAKEYGAQDRETSAPPTWLGWKRDRLRRLAPDHSNRLVLKILDRAECLGGYGVNLPDDPNLALRELWRSLNFARSSLAPRDADTP